MSHLLSLFFVLMGACSARLPAQVAPVVPDQPRAPVAPNTPVAPVPLDSTAEPVIREGNVSFEPTRGDGQAQWLCRGADGAVRVHVLSFDNGPDYLVEGLRRYVDGGKMGFVDAECRVVLPARWDFVEPFSSGRARVCRGCRLRPDGEHTAVEGGEWRSVDRSGHEQ